MQEGGHRGSCKAYKEGAVHKLRHTNFKNFTPPPSPVSHSVTFSLRPPVLRRLSMTFIPYNFQVEI